jgi:arylsulfatase A-like enzyme
MASALDLLPTLAGLAGARVPEDRTIDGKNIFPLMTNDSRETPHEAFFYHHFGQLEAVRAGDFKLHVRKGDQQTLELYNLREDIKEQENLAESMPDKVKELQGWLDLWRRELGDTATDSVGVNRREIGKVAEGKPLTQFDPDYPYFIAEYDIAEWG